MWFFDWFATYFSDVGYWFEDTADNIASVPYVGGSLSSPFRTAAGYFHNVSTAAEYASSWVDDADENISDLLNNLSEVWDYSYGWLTTTVNNAMNTASDAYDYAYGSLTSTLNSVSMTASDVYSYAYGSLTSTLNSVSAKATNVYNYAYGTLTTAVNNAAAQASSAYNSVTNVGAGLASDIWLWITSNRLSAYLDVWKNGLQSLVIDWVKGALAYLITEGFVVLENSWSSFTTGFHWLTMKIIDLMIERAVSFAAPLWSLADAVVGALWDDRE